MAAATFFFYNANLTEHRSCRIMVLQGSLESIAPQSGLKGNKEFKQNGPTE